MPALVVRDVTRRDYKHSLFYSCRDGLPKPPALPKERAGTSSHAKMPEPNVCGLQKALILPIFAA